MESVSLQNLRPSSRLEAKSRREQRGEHQARDSMPQNIHETFKDSSENCGDDMKTKKNEKRMGGKALSLEAFTNAKSMPRGYNPSFISKLVVSPDSEEKLKTKRQTKYFKYPYMIQNRGFIKSCSKDPCTLHKRVAGDYGQALEHAAFYQYSELPIYQWLIPPGTADMSMIVRMKEVHNFLQQKKQREFYKNAKHIRKFKKSIKRDAQFDEEHLHSLPNIEAGDGDEGSPKNFRKIEKKKRTSLRALGEEVERKRAEAEKARMEREVVLQAKREERAKAEAKRKSLRDSMLKRTRSGQPVMKYRIQHLLQGLLEKP